MTDLYLRTSIRSEAEKDTLKMGCKAALAASSLIVGSEYVLPLLEFDNFGFWAWIVGGSAAGLGLLPYQRLKSQKKNPDILHSTEETISLFMAKHASLPYRGTKLSHFIIWILAKSMAWHSTSKRHLKAFRINAAKSMA